MNVRSVSLMERSNRISVTSSTSMLKHSGLGLDYWKSRAKIVLMYDRLSIDYGLVFVTQQNHFSLEQKWIKQGGSHTLATLGILAFPSLLTSILKSQIPNFKPNYFWVRKQFRLHVVFHTGSSHERTCTLPAYNSLKFVAF